MEVIGRIKQIGPVQDISATFKKRELIVTTEEQYPQHLLIEFTQDKCDLLNAFQIGEPVRVGINLRGREWVNPQGETRYFNSIQGWRIERPQQTVPQQGNPYGAQQGYPPQQGYGQPQQNQGYGQQNQGSGFAQNLPQQPGSGNPFPPAPDFQQEEPDDLPF